jgi:MFS superfamily sulfate permease-like transporter
VVVVVVIVVAVVTVVVGVVPRPVVVIVVIVVVVAMSVERSGIRRRGQQRSDECSREATSVPGKRRVFPGSDECSDE